MENFVFSHSHSLFLSLSHSLKRSLDDTLAVVITCILVVHLRAVDGNRGESLQLSLHASFAFDNADVFPQFSLLIVVARQWDTAQTNHERGDRHGDHAAHNHATAFHGRHRAILAGESGLAITVYVVVCVPCARRGLARPVLAAGVRAHGLACLAGKPGFALAPSLDALAVGASIFGHGARVFTCLLVARIASPPHFAVAYATYAFPLAAGAPTLGHAAFCPQGQRFARDLAAVHTRPSRLALARARLLVADTLVTAPVRALALDGLLVARRAVPSNATRALPIFTASVTRTLRMLGHGAPRLAERHHLHLCDYICLAVTASELRVTEALSVRTRAVTAAFALLRAGEPTARVHVAGCAIVPRVAVAIAMPAETVATAVGRAETRSVAV